MSQRLPWLICLLPAALTIPLLSPAAGLAQPHASAATPAPSHKAKPQNPFGYTRRPIETPAVAPGEHDSTYARPFLLRAIEPGNMTAIDVSAAFAKTRNSQVISWIFAKAITDNLSLHLRWGLLYDIPKTGPRSDSFLNPSLGALYTILRPSQNVRFGLLGSITLPISTAAGDKPVAPAPDAIRKGVLARSSMDNAMFDANYIAPTLGAGVAYTTDEITTQAEVTVSEHILVRGKNVESDRARTNLTAGLHFAYFPIHSLSLGVELRYQQWLAGDAIRSGANNSAIDTWTLGFGPRAKWRIGEKHLWICPALSFTMGLNFPIGFGGAFAEEYRTLQVDVPLLF